jgi:hypothetical protein
MRSKIGKVCVVDGQTVVLCEAPAGCKAGDLVAVSVANPTGEGVRARIIAAIEREGGEAPKSALLRLCQGVSAAEIDTCVVEMQEAGEVDVRKIATGGRPVSVFRLTHEVPNV